MEKPFEVGEWVWYWGAGTSAGWYKVVRIEGRQVWFHGDYGPTWATPNRFTRDPIIPPKPKKMVTKEAEPMDTVLLENTDSSHPPTTRHRTFRVPLTATNIRCTYDIEE